MLQHMGIESVFSVVLNTTVIIYKITAIFFNCLHKIRILREKENNVEMKSDENTVIDAGFFPFLVIRKICLSWHFFNENDLLCAFCCV